MTGCVVLEFSVGHKLFDT